jgi:4'-phosphopantetheinyl transferase EntD
VKSSDFDPTLVFDSPFYESTNESRALSQALAEHVPSKVVFGVVSVRTDNDIDELFRVHSKLFPEEAALISKAVPKRVREFLAARNLARELFLRLGVAPSSLGRGSMGEPMWPLGVTGSISHSTPLVVVAAARTKDYRALGVDIEPNLPLPPDVGAYVSFPQENEHSPASRGVFVAKEAFYKAHFGEHHRMLDFKEVRLNWLPSGWVATEISPPPDAIGPTTLQGHFAVKAGWLAAFCAIEA